MINPLIPSLFSSHEIMGIEINGSQKFFKSSQFSLLAFWNSICVTIKTYAVIKEQTDAGQRCVPHWANEVARGISFQSVV